MENAQTVFFVGKPGSGKGTQAKLLSEKTGWKIIGSGEQFRALAAEKNPLGEKIKSIIDAGILTPHWFPMYLFLKAVFSVPSSEGVIFDGFSRRVPEAELVTNALTWFDRPFVVFHLRVSDEEVQRRLELRRSVENRADDHAIPKRIEEYYENTEKAIEIFRTAGVLIDIDGERTPEQIAEDIRGKLGLV